MMITLPMPPSINHYWHLFVAKGKPRIALSDLGRNYRVDCLAAILEQGVSRKDCLPRDVRVSLEIWIYPASNRLFDLDNRIKPLQDALVKCGLIDDDSQIDKLIVHRQKPDKKSPRVVIEIGVMP